MRFSSLPKGIKGEKYGFVRFFNVRDVQRLVVKLGHILIDNKKLFANIARFQRSTSGIFHKNAGKDENYMKNSYVGRIWQTPIKISLTRKFPSNFHAKEFSHHRRNT